MALLDNLLIDERFDHISRVHIDGDNCDNLVTDLNSEIASDTLNELSDAVLDQLEELLHGRFRARLKVIKSTDGLLSPNNLGSEKGKLSAVTVKPQLSGVLRDPVVGGVLGLKNDRLKCILHLFLKITQVVLYGVHASEWC